MPKTSFNYQQVRYSFVLGFIPFICFYFLHFLRLLLISEHTTLDNVGYFVGYNTDQYPYL